jgi:hypothetical protein
MKFLYLTVVDAGLRATLDVDGEPVALDVDGTGDDVLRLLLPRIKAPAAAFSDDDKAQLASMRKEFEATKTWAVNNARGAAQVDLQNRMASLVAAERAAAVASTLQSLLASSSASPPAPVDSAAAAAAAKAQADLDAATQAHADATAKADAAKATADAALAQLDAARAAAGKA